MGDGPRRRAITPDPVPCFVTGDRRGADGRERTRISPRRPPLGEGRLRWAGRGAPPGRGAGLLAVVGHRLHRRKSWGAAPLHLGRHGGAKGVQTCLRCSNPCLRRHPPDWLPWRDPAQVRRWGGGVACLRIGWLRGVGRAERRGRGSLRWRSELRTRRRRGGLLSESGGWSSRHDPKRGACRGPISRRCGLRLLRHRGTPSGLTPCARAGSACAGSGQGSAASSAELACRVVGCATPGALNHRPPPKGLFSPALPPLPHQLGKPREHTRSSLPAKARPVSRREPAPAGQQRMGPPFSRVAMGERHRGVRSAR